MSVLREFPGSFEQPHGTLLCLFNQTHINKHLDFFHSFVTTNSVITALLLTCVSKSTGESPGGIVVLLEGMCLVIFIDIPKILSKEVQPVYLPTKSVNLL